MNRLLFASLALIVSLYAAEVPAAPKKVDGGADVNWQPLKKPDGSSSSNMTPRECGLIGGRVTAVTQTNCSSKQACFVKLEGGATGAACIS